MEVITEIPTKFKSYEIQNMSLRSNYRLLAAAFSS